MVKILVIDDDRMNCDLLQAVLTRHGYEVHSATSGLEGLKLFRQHNPRVTILDLRMPEMDGLTVLKEIRAIDPQAPVIILGGGATEVQENQARALRVTDFVRKGCRWMCSSKGSIASSSSRPESRTPPASRQVLPRTPEKRSSSSMMNNWFVICSSSSWVFAGIGPRHQRWHSGSLHGRRGGRTS
jgi:CheY-like chemotaxis protein